MEEHNVNITRYIRTMNEITVALVGLFCSIASGIVTFLLTKRKYNTEVDSQQISNMKDAFDGYKLMMQNTVEEQNKKIEELKKENSSLKDQLHELQKQVIALLSTNPLKSKAMVCCNTDDDSPDEGDKSD